MKPARECEDRLRNLVALVMGELDLAAARELEDHLARCHACRKVHDVLVQEETEVRSGFEELVLGLGPVERSVLEKCEHLPRAHVSAFEKPYFRRFKNMILAHKRLSATVAAATALAASLVLYLSLFSSSGSAYALEQTAEANNRITSYHVRVTPAPIESLCEAWVQLNPDGTLHRARSEFFSAEDGPKVVIVSKDRAEVWFKLKHSHVIVGDKAQVDRTLKELEATRSYFDPKLAFQHVMAAKQAGKAQVDASQPVQGDQLITLTVTSKERPDHKQVYDVDPETKLVERVFELVRKDGDWQVVQMREYLDYNREFDSSVFQPETPRGFITVDLIKNKVGLEKGDLADDAIATKVAREFFESLIAGDYQKASPLFSGIPADQLRKMYGETKFLRIAEVGKPTLDAKTKALKVPVKLEIEEKGARMVKELSAWVRAEFEGRWTIIDVT